MKPTSLTSAPGLDLPEELRWVRSLARRLVSDPDLAEDLTQDAYLASTRRPPRPLSRRAWFVTTVRNLAWNRRAKDDARAARERASARPEEEPGPDTLAERLELSATLIAAVESLREPVREVVLLRFFEDLEPAAIAQRLRRDPSTVRSQLARAMGQLRAKLDVAYGERRTWSAIAVALGRVPREGVQGSPVPLAKGIGSAAVALGTAVAVWVVVARTPDPAGPGAQGTSAIRPAGDATVVHGDRPALATGGGEHDAARRSDGMRGELLSLHGTLLSDERVPFDAWVELVDAAGDEYEARPDAEGRWRIDGIGPGPWQVWASAPRMNVVSHELGSIDGLGDGGLALELESAELVYVRVLGPEGRAHALTFGRYGKLRVLGARAVAVATLGPPPPAFLDYLARVDHELSLAPMQPDSGRWLEPGLEVGLLGSLDLPRTDGVWISLVYGSHVLASKPFRDVVQGVMTFTLDAGAHRALEGGVRVRHVDADSGDAVQHGFGTHRPISLNTIVGGALRGDVLHVEGLPPGWTRVGASWPTHEEVSELVWVGPGQTVDRTNLVTRKADGPPLSFVDAAGDAVAAFARWSPRGRGLRPRDVLFAPKVSWTYEGSSRLVRGDEISLVVLSEDELHFPVHLTVGDEPLRVVVPSTRNELVLDGTALIRPVRATLADETGFPFWTGLVGRDQLVEVDTPVELPTLWLGHGDRVDVSVPLTWDEGIRNVMLVDYVE